MHRDLRTRKGRELEVLQYIAQHGGFSVFWATKFATRAHAIDRLSNTKKIKRVAGRQYPFCTYQLTEP